MDGPANDLRIAAVVGLPERVAEHGHQPLSVSVLRCVPTADHRRKPNEFAETGRGLSHLNLRVGEVVDEVASLGPEHHRILEQAASVPVANKGAWSDPPVGLGGPGQGNVPEEDHPVSVGERERPQEDAVRDSEGSGGDTDAQPKGEDDEDRCEDGSANRAGRAARVVSAAWATRGGESTAEQGRYRPDYLFPVPETGIQPARPLLARLNILLGEISQNVLSIGRSKHVAKHPLREPGRAVAAHETSRSGWASNPSHMRSISARAP